jgi:hypothetical protein
LICVKRRQADNAIFSHVDRRVAVMWTSQNSLENSGSSELAVLWMTVAGIVVAACLAVKLI